MAATEIYKQEDISVFLDIGTNGELVIGNKDFLVAGAGAAGPALEGGVVKNRYAGGTWGCRQGTYRKWSGKYPCDRRN